MLAARPLLLLSVSVAWLLLSASLAAAAASSKLLAETLGASSLHFDTDGTLYASSFGSGNLLRLSGSELSVVQLYNSSGSPYPPLNNDYSVDIHDGRLYTLTGYSSLVAFDLASGALLSEVLLLPAVSSPVGLAVAPDGSGLWTTDESLDPLKKVAFNGSLLQTVLSSAYFLNGISEFSEAVTVDSAGSVYLVALVAPPPTYAYGYGQVLKFDSDGRFLYNFSVVNANKTATITSGIALAPNGDIFVTDSELPNQAYRFSNDGVLLQSFNAPTEYFGSFGGCAVDPTGSQLLVTDEFNAAVLTFDIASGRLLSQQQIGASSFVFPTAVVQANGLVYVTSPAMGYIAALAPNGTQVQDIYLSDVPDHTTLGLAVDGAGSLYVSDAAYAAVYKFSAAGELLQTFNTSDPALAMNAESNIAFSEDGQLLVSDTYNNRIVRFAADGSVLQIINVSSPIAIAALPGGGCVYVTGPLPQMVAVLSETGALLVSFNVSYPWAPAGLAVSQTAPPFIYVADNANSNILLFTLTGTLAGSLPYTLSSPALQTVYGLSWTASDSLLVADYEGNRVYELLGVLPGSGGSVKGDPAFVGLLGQQYQVHGIDGEVYNLVSSPSLQINALFRYLSSGVCPVLAGVVSSACWSHPGSYLAEIGLQQRLPGSSVLHSLLMRAGSHDRGFAQVTVDGQDLAVGASFSDGSGFVLRFLDSHTLTARTAQLQLVFSNSDQFINQQVELLSGLQQLRQDDWHGLLGQTHSRALHSSTLKYIEGDVDDYVVRGRDIMGSGFLFNRFQPSQVGQA